MERRAGDYDTWYLQGDSAREEKDLKRRKGQSTECQALVFKFGITRGVSPALQDGIYLLCITEVTLITMTMILLRGEYWGW